MSNNDVDVKYVEIKLYLVSLACRRILELLQLFYKIYSEIYKFWSLSSGFLWYLGGGGGLELG